MWDKDKLYARLKYSLKARRSRHLASCTALVRALFTYFMKERVFEKTLFYVGCLFADRDKAISHISVPELIRLTTCHVAAMMYVIVL